MNSTFYFQFNFSFPTIQYLKFKNASSQEKGIQPDPTSILKEFKNALLFKSFYNNFDTNLKKNQTIQQALSSPDSNLAQSIFEYLSISAIAKISKF